MRGHNKTINALAIAGGRWHSMLSLKSRNKPFETLIFFASFYTGSYDGVISKFDIATGTVERCTGNTRCP
jgi:hypothetical protein